MTNEKLNASSKDCDKAWESQVTDFFTKNDESTYDIYNVYIAYRDYLKYAANPSAIPRDMSLDDYENEYIISMLNYYSGRTNSSFASAKDIYTTNIIDVSITGIIHSILNTMDPEKTSVGVGSRFIDQVAQYAYYAYPYSSEQAEFIDNAVQYQINTITYLVMMYQDFVAHRADYFKNNPCEDYEKIWSYCYNDYYVSLLNKYTKTIENFLNGDIYLKEINAHTTLDKYVRKDSTTVYYDEEKESFIVKNEHLTTKNPYNPNILTPNMFAQTYMSFYKNASVSVKDGKLVFNPFYILNGNQLKINQLFLKYFDNVVTNTHGLVPAWAFYDTHYLSCDYLSFKDGVYNDGTNTYVPISDPKQLKGIINETYYTANNCTPYSYFSQFINYTSGNPLYLLLKGDTYVEDNIASTEYTHFPVFNMSTARAYNSEWKSEMMSNYYLQSDRKGDENKTNSMYTLILVPKDNEIKSKVDTKLIGEGKVEVTDYKTTDEHNKEVKIDTYNESNGTALSGEKVTVNITAPENRWITNITVQYHNDTSDLSKVTEEKVLSTGINSNEFTLNYAVPYSNVTISVETKEIPKTLNVDNNGNYIINSYDNLCQMATMVNSGYSEYTKGSYVLTKNINIPKDTVWSNPIGTEENPFCGTFDGQGHTISNLWFDARSTTENMGLFGVVIGGTVEKLNIIMSTYTVLKDHNTVGSVCGYLKNGTISDCISIGDFCACGKYVGGIVGACENSTIKNCASELYMIVEATLSDGICAQATNTQIIDCTSNTVIQK